MVCTPKANASAVGSIRSGVTVRNIVSHAYDGEKLWTLDAVVSSQVDSMDLQANVRGLWETWLDAHPDNL